MSRNPRYLLETIGHYDRSDSQLLSIGYTRDSAGNPLSIGSDVYTYDANNRLDSWVNNTDYNYDWVGNRLTPGDMEYNEADQLTDWPGQHKYTYLVTGSLAEQQNSAGTEVEKEYIYTYRNLLSTVTHYDEPNDPVSSMQWDAEDNRVSFTSSTGGTTYFVYDPTAGIPAVIEEVTPSGPVFYVREPNGSLIARVEGETTYYYHFDALGSTRVLTDGNGAKTDEYTYDAWGKLTNHTTYTGSVPQPYMYVGQLGYYSHYQDDHLFDDPSAPNSGWQMLHLGVRFYDPALGRFTQVDPVRDGHNWYNYVNDRPLVLIDPHGQWGWLPPSDSNCAIYRKPGDPKGEFLYSVCRNGGDNSWSNCVRGCLQYFYKQPGGDTNQAICHAHEKCYKECDKHGTRAPIFKCADAFGKMCHMVVDVIDPHECKDCGDPKPPVLIPILLL